MLDRQLAQSMLAITVTHSGENVCAIDIIKYNIINTLIMVENYSVLVYYVPQLICLLSLNLEQAGL